MLDEFTRMKTRSLSETDMGTSPECIIRQVGGLSRAIDTRREYIPRLRTAAACAVLLLASWQVVHMACAAEPATESGEIAAGRRIYLEGKLSSGERLTATVQDDVPLAGSAAACAQCHQRSGLGTLEGGTLVRTISAPDLARVSTDARQRPAYSDETLARALREGVDSAGQPLSRLMPRYALQDAEVSALTAYLKTLSAQTSPGVSDKAIRFATIVTDDVPPIRRKAMYKILDAYFAEANAGQAQAVKKSYGPSRSRKAAGGKRTWILERWALTGPPETWTTQLETYYRAQPVFAVLSGIGAGDWQPIHEFCETRELPCLLPNTALPALAADDYYTLYFSRGLTLEAEVLAAHLSKRAAPAKLLQVYRGDVAGLTASGALKRAAAGRYSVSDWMLGERETLTVQTLAARLEATKSEAVAIWLPPDWMAELGDGRPIFARPVRLYFSSTQLNGELSAVPGPLRRVSSVVHPFAQNQIRRLDTWLARQKIARGDFTLQAQTYFACLIATEGIKRAGEKLHRDYFLEVIDRMSMAPMGSGFPSPEFAPNRRYLINGAFVLEVGEGDKTFIKNPRWIIP
jgi:mono/diheme cytochrome c family protein